MNKSLRFIYRMGVVGNDFFDTIRSMARLFFDAVGSMFRFGGTTRTSFVKQIIRQILFTGVEAMPLVGIVAFLCGVTIVIQATTNMPKLGATEYFGSILVMIVVRELGPFFTSLVVIGRSGSALAAYIGTMRVGGEVSALEMMGIDPVHFLVMPAFAGFMISMICLSTYFALIAIIGGLLVAQLTVNVPFGIFISKIIDALNYMDILISVLKSVAFGAIIAIVSSHYGLVVRSIRGVPQAAIKAVVGSMATTIVLNIIFTVCFYVR